MANLQSQLSWTDQEQPLCQYSMTKVCDWTQVALKSAFDVLLFKNMGFRQNLSEEPDPNPSKARLGPEAPRHPL